MAQDKRLILEVVKVHLAWPPSCCTCCVWEYRMRGERGGDGEGIRREREGERKRLMCESERVSERARARDERRERGREQARERDSHSCEC